MWDDGVNTAYTTHNTNIIIMMIFMIAPNSSARLSWDLETDHIFYRSQKHSFLNYSRRMGLHQPLTTTSRSRHLLSPRQDSTALCQTQTQETPWVLTLTHLYGTRPWQWNKCTSTSMWTHVVEYSTHWWTFSYLYMSFWPSQELDEAHLGPSLRLP